MAYKINGTTVVDNSRNVCACCVTACCITGSSKVTVPTGDTASRPGNAAGQLYFDTDEGSLIVNDGSQWAAAGGSQEPIVLDAGATYNNSTYTFMTAVKPSAATNCGTISSFINTFSGVKRGISSVCQGGDMSSGGYYSKMAVLGGDGSFSYTNAVVTGYCIEGTTQQCYSSIAGAIGLNHHLFLRNGCKYEFKDAEGFSYHQIRTDNCCGANCAFFFPANTCAQCYKVTACSGLITLVAAASNYEDGGYWTSGCTCGTNKGLMCNCPLTVIPYDNLRCGACKVYSISHFGAATVTAQPKYGCGTCMKYTNGNQSVPGLCGQGYSLASTMGAMDCHCIPFSYCCSNVSTNGDFSNIAAWYGSVGGGVYNTCCCGCCGCIRAHVMGYCCTSCCCMKSAPGFNVYTGPDNVSYIGYYQNNSGGCTNWAGTCCIQTNRVPTVLKVDNNTGCIKHYKGYYNSAIGGSCAFACLENDGSLIFRGTDVYSHEKVYFNNGCIIGVAFAPFSSNYGYQNCFTADIFVYTCDLEPVSGDRYSFRSIALCYDGCCCNTCAVCHMARDVTGIAWDMETCTALFKYGNGGTYCDQSKYGVGLARMKVNLENRCIECFQMVRKHSCMTCWECWWSANWGAWQWCSNCGNCYMCCCLAANSGWHINNRGDVAIINHYNSWLNCCCAANSKGFVIGKDQWTNWTCHFCDLVPTNIFNDPYCNGCLGGYCCELCCYYKGFIGPWNCEIYCCCSQLLCWCENCNAMCCMYLSCSCHRIWYAMYPLPGTTANNGVCATESGTVQDAFCWTKKPKGGGHYQCICDAVCACDLIT